MQIKLPKLIFPVSHFKFKESGGKFYIYDQSRRKYVVLTSEEWVRQNCMHFLSNHKSFPVNLISVEKSFKLNNLVLRYDIVVYSRRAKPLILVECKAPDVKITQQTFDQIASYNLELKVPYLLVTNGKELFFCSVDFNNSTFVYFKEVPDYKSISE
jgi:type I site-specific restriction endonuclease